MLALSRLLLWSIAFITAAGLAARMHPVLGTLVDLLRWPMVAVAFLAGGLAFSRGVLRTAAFGLLVIAALFGEWLHARLVCARTDDAPPAGAPLRVLTYDLGAQAQNPDMVLEAIHGHPADVVLLQEVTGAWRSRLDREPVLRGMNREIRGRGDGALAIYFRGPLQHVTLLAEPQGGDVALCASLDHAGAPWLACSVRLSEPFWRPDPLELAEHWVVNARRRQAQWSVVDEHLGRAAAGRHVVVAGNFATTEWEPLLRDVRAGLVDAFRSASWSPGATWPALLKEPPIPVLRWDYAWVSPSVTCLDADVVALTGGPHRAVRVTLQPLALTSSARSP